MIENLMYVGKAKEDNGFTLFFETVNGFNLFDEDEEAVSSAISLEFPTGEIDLSRVIVEASPIDVMGEHYDWREISLPIDEIEERVNMANVA